MSEKQVTPYKKKKVFLDKKFSVVIYVVTLVLAVICRIFQLKNNMNFEKGTYINSGFNLTMAVILVGFALLLAVMIFGQWKPTRIALAALLFGLFRALSNVYSGIGFLADLNISSSIYNMMPYVISLIVLAFTSKKSRAPKAEGIPYDKGQR